MEPSPIAPLQFNQQVSDWVFGSLATINNSGVHSLLLKLCPPWTFDISKASFTFHIFSLVPNPMLCSRSSSTKISSCLFFFFFHLSHYLRAAVRSYCLVSFLCLWYPCLLSVNFFETHGLLHMLLYTFDLSSSPKLTCLYQVFHENYSVLRFQQTVG